MNQKTTGSLGEPIPPAPPTDAAIKVYVAELPDCVRLAELGDFGPLHRCVAALQRLSREL